MASHRRKQEQQTPEVGTLAEPVDPNPEQMIGTDDLP
jgi:hypothetical protein